MSIKLVFRERNYNFRQISSGEKKVIKVSQEFGINGLTIY